MPPLPTSASGLSTHYLSARHASGPKKRKIHSTPEGDDCHHDLFRDLGYINSAFAVLAGLRLFKIPSTGSEAGDVALHILAQVVLGWANGWQAYLD